MVVHLVQGADPNDGSGDWQRQSGPMIDRQQSWSNAGMKMSSYLRRLRYLVEDTLHVELN
jgi:hypothetical protein